MSQESDEKLRVCTSFIVEQIELHTQHANTNRPSLPFVLGINGVQGIGKTSLVSAIARHLEQPPYELHSAVLSIDDFYLTHEAQSQLAATHPDNPLVQHRGQPSTHDLDLALSVISALEARQEVGIPSYDKSAFGGQGDRVPSGNWTKVNQDGCPPINVVILEGWCLGFRALDEAQLTAMWEKAVEARNRTQGYPGRLGHNRLEDVQYVNEALNGYDVITNRLDALIHLDAEDPQYVYKWRLEQEAELRRNRGSGMTEQGVMNFVNGYYPSYELFTDRLRAGALDSRKGSQLRLVIGRDRTIKAVVQI